MKTNIPIKGKFYKVISGPYEGFVGEAVSVDMEKGLPVILQDLEYNARAVNVSEIEETLKQPEGKNIQGNEN
jgi:transcription antitermination factor NusG